MELNYKAWPACKQLDRVREGLSVPFVLLACRSPLGASSSVSRKLEAEPSFSELILNGMKTQVIMCGSLCRQQALSASLMINAAAGNVLQLVDQFNDAHIWLHPPPALTSAGISFPHTGSSLVLGNILFTNPHGLKKKKVIFLVLVSTQVQRPKGVCWARHQEGRTQNAFI